MLTFKHAGRMGDVFYSLYWATCTTHCEPFDLVLRVNVEAPDLSNRPYLMTREDAEFMRPLLAVQPYIRSVLIADDDRYIPSDCVELDAFRRNMQLILGREIRQWYYPLRCKVIPGEWERVVLSLPEPVEQTDRIAICFTPRYREDFNIDCLEQFKDKLVLIGLSDEHRAFCERYFDVDYYPVRDALEMLRFMKSCRCFVGNVSGVFAIAECAKVPRVLCLRPGGGDVRVYGNGLEARNHEELIKSINQYMR